MTTQISIGFITEGSTDVRFLESIIQRTFEEIAFECSGEMEVLQLQHIKIEEKKLEFIEKVLKSAEKASENGVIVLCVHIDADDSVDISAFTRKINPAFAHVKQSEKEVCKNLVAIVPVQMTEAWMLADKKLLKDEIGTTKPDNDLELDKAPESYNDPKTTIEKAIYIACQGLTQRRRRKLKIEGLYQPIGQKISIEKLDKLPSYKKFKNNVREAYRSLNYLH